jgi:butyrate kinase
MRVLAINPGSTSTKIAVYEDDAVLLKRSVEHQAAELRACPRVADQYGLRRQAVLDALAAAGIKTDSLDAAVGRGGFLPPVQSGAYRVNDALVRRLAEAPRSEHAANLGAPIARSIADPLGIPAFIYDSVAVDELDPIARISGHASVERLALSHVLNLRATARRCAADLGKRYEDCDFIAVHLGGGITATYQRHGQIVDLVADDEGAFSPERTGYLPLKHALAAGFSGRPEAEVRRMFRGEGGMVSYLGTADSREVEERIDAGDAQASLVYEAMAYQVAKDIGALATAARGKLDAIILTGGIAYSERFTGWIAGRVGFIAPVKVYPGENELESLAQGALRVLRGEETARDYRDELYF